MRIIAISLLAALTATRLAADLLPVPITDQDYFPVGLPEAELGQLLFYDPILSGNQNIACATCHHPAFGTSDAVPLALGEGAIGLGPDRKVDPAYAPEKRVARNAPALFNLGAREFTVLFHDGRLEADPNWPGGIRTPMDDDMVSGFVSVLSAQTMFPVLSRDEMAGTHRENEVGRAVRQGLITGNGGAWDIIARRVAALPEYATQFSRTYPHIISPEEIAFTDISNAIAAFMAFEWRSDTAPFDAMLRQQAQLDVSAQRGMEIFYARGGCGSCHAGPFLTDHRFHAAGAPQIGPGKAADFEAHQRDEGRFGVTGDPADRYAFRTPSLRNVALTAPYGHAGAHASLREFLTDHADPIAALDRFDTTTVRLPDFKSGDFAVMQSRTDRQAIADAITLRPVKLDAQDIDDLLAFLASMTDPVAIKGRLGVPKTVPSGLPVPKLE